MSLHKDELSSALFMPFLAPGQFINYLYLKCILRENVVTEIYGYVIQHDNMVLQYITWLGALTRIC